jgi:tyrosyl-tRNA synthetase
MKINREKIKNLLTRGVEQIIDQKNLESRLLAGEKLRVKHGIDPTSPKLHLGHANILRKLREFQCLGHKIVLVIGDYTAQIGDPSDKLEKRPFLSEKQVRENMKTYKKQIGKILDPLKVEWHYNSEWLKKLNLHDFDRLADLFSVQQMIARRNFKERWERGEEISIRELHYPLYQGYDSVAIKADLEIGGNDQLFNFLAGRKIQEAYHQRPQDIMTLKMLEGLDGEKMSKSRKNVINILDSPQEMYGKIMSMHDEMILKYFELCTDVEMAEIDQIKKAMEAGANPRDSKAKLAFEIVKIYHGLEGATEAEREFKRVFKEKEAPFKMPSYKLQAISYKLPDLLVETRLAPSKSEARRLIEQGAVRIDREIVRDWRTKLKIKRGMILQVGKRKFVQLDIKM